MSCLGSRLYGKQKDMLIWVERGERGVIRDKMKERSFSAFTLSFRVIRNKKRGNNFQGFLNNKAKCQIFPYFFITLFSRKTSYLL